MSKQIWALYLYNCFLYNLCKLLTLLFDLLIFHLFQGENLYRLLFYITNNLLKQYLCFPSLLILQLKKFYLNFLNFFKRCLITIPSWLWSNWLEEKKSKWKWFRMHIKEVYLIPELLAHLMTSKNKLQSHLPKYKLRSVKNMCPKAQLKTRPQIKCSSYRNQIQKPTLARYQRNMKYGLSNKLQNYQ